MEERLQKYMAEAGVASRRASEQMILDGRVKVNGHAVTELGMKVSDSDRIMVDGKVISKTRKMRYIMLNKPAGYLSSVTDDRERQTVVDLVSGDIRERVYPVGRLDYNTEGLLLLSNDGDFTYRVTHPSHEMEKTYEAVVSGTVTRAELDKLCRGVMIDGRKTSPAKARVLDAGGNSTRIELIIHEGRNRQVRRMMEAIGHDVRHLKRVAIGNVRLGPLPLGRWRHLNDKEIAYLMGVEKR